MKILIGFLLSLPLMAQFGAAKSVINGTGAPNAAQCTNINNVGKVYARKDGAAANSTFYVCSNTAASTYAWELLGSGGGADVTASNDFSGSGNKFGLGTTGYLDITIANASVTGTTANRLAILTGAPSTAVVAGTSNTSGIIGIVSTGAGTTGNARIVVRGNVQCDFDAATTAGNYVIASTTTGGKCADAGSSVPAGKSIIGRVKETIGAAGLAYVVVGIQEAPGSSTTSVQVARTAYDGTGGCGDPFTNITYNLPANTLAVGDMLRVSAQWYNSGSAASRGFISIGGTDYTGSIPMGTTGGGTPAGADGTVLGYVSAIGASGAIKNIIGKGVRGDNSANTYAITQSVTIDTTTAIAILAAHRNCSGGGNTVTASLSVEIIRAANL